MDLIERQHRSSQKGRRTNAYQLNLEVPKVSNRDFAQGLKHDSATSQPETPKVSNRDFALKEIEPSLELPKNIGKTSSHQMIFHDIQKLRGYPSGNGKAEGSAIKKMLSQGYSAAEIVACYTATKADAFWIKKPLTMMSLANQIGEWQKHQASIQDDPNKWTKFKEEIEARRAAWDDAEND